MRTLLLALFFVPVLLFAQTNEDISNSTYFDGEPFMAVNPQNQNNIVVAWMGVYLYRVTMKTICSFDGGKTWGHVNNMPHMGTTWTSADPTMCFKKDGTLYLAYIDYTPSPAAGGIYVTHSTDGGISWSTPVQAFSVSEDAGKDPIDRPWMVIDNSTSSTSGNLYLATKPAYWIPAPNRPYFKRSADGGQTWSAYRYVDSTGFLVGNVIQQPMAVPAVNATGKLCIAYPSYLASQSVFPRMLLATSHNGGEGFSYNAMFNIPSAANDTNLKLGYCLAVHPIDPNKMAFVSVYAPSGDADIGISTSGDGGATWSSLVRVNDDPLGNGVLQDMPWCSYDSSGNLCVTWRDRRNAPSTGFFQPNDFYAAVSTNNGASFQPNIRLSTVTAQFDSILLQKGNDFMGCEYMNDTIYASWGDTRTGDLEIYFAKCGSSTSSINSPTVIATERLLQVFPNPAGNVLNISWNILPEGDAEISIKDMLGKIIKIFHKANVNKSESLDISDIPAGNYILQVKDDSGKMVAKFAVVH
ncbi:MAG: T9SS type A sorting domain-containing protein [Bacteroidales bacterium]|jgi:hypothetical protein